LDERELKALAEAVRDGDQESFRVLVDSLSRTLIAMAFRYTRDWEWARDLTQETWIKVHQNLNRWNPDRSFTAWLHAIHRNGCIDHSRRSWVRRESVPGNEVVVRLTGAAPGGPEEDLEREELHRQLLKATEGLSESQRQVFLRVDLERGDQNTVAAALGIKSSTLRATLHFARKRVATVLREMEEST
jgi:RNA polymerase sigma-70 factor (ECF subfamily)